MKDFELFWVKTGQNLFKKGPKNQICEFSSDKKILHFFKDQKLSIYGQNEEHLNNRFEEKYQNRQK